MVVLLYFDHPSSPTLLPSRGEGSLCWFLPDCEKEGIGMFCICSVFFCHSDLPLFLIEFGEKHISVKLMFNAGKINNICDRNCLAINFATTDNHHLWYG